MDVVCVSLKYVYFTVVTTLDKHVDKGLEALGGHYNTLQEFPAQKQQQKMRLQQFYFTLTNNYSICSNFNSKKGKNYVKYSEKINKISATKIVFHTSVPNYVFNFIEQLIFLTCKTNVN